MPQLAEIATISPRKRPNDRLIPWEEMEALLSQIRQALNCNNYEACKLMGYAGATHLAEWKRSGAALTGKMAALGVLADLRITITRKKEHEFSYSDLLDILGALAREPEPKRALIADIAKKIAAYD